MMLPRVVTNGHCPVQITAGYATGWDKSPIQWKGNYTSQWAEAGTMPVVKQFVGDFVTDSGLSVGFCLACSDIAVSC
jgi:hypothetical protein